MKKKIKKIISNIQIIACMLLLVGCSTDLKTDLQIEDNESGQRVIKMEIKNSDIEKYGKKKITQIENMIGEKMPKEMVYAKYEEENYTSYTFSIPFDSIADYQEKVAAILGKDPIIEFNEPNSIFASGISLKEDFTSEDLMKWFKKGMKDIGLEDSISTKFKNKETKVTFKGIKYKTSYQVNVNKIEYNEIDYIAIQTTINPDNTYTRIIEFIIPNATYKKIEDTLLPYMNSVVPIDGQGMWVEDIAYPKETFDAKKQKNYRITFNATDEKDLITKTNTVFNSERGHLNKEKRDSKKPLHIQYKWREYLDFSNYGGTENNTVNVKYRFTNIDQSFVYTKDTSTYQIEDEVVGVSSSNYEFDMETGYNISDIRDTTTIKNETEMKKQFSIIYSDKTHKKNLQETKAYFKNIKADTLTISSKEKEDSSTMFLTFDGKIEDVVKDIKTVLNINASIEYKIVKNKFLKDIVAYNETINYKSFKELIGYDKEINYKLHKRERDAVTNFTSSINPKDIDLKDTYEIKVKDEITVHYEAKHSHSNSTSIIIMYIFLAIVIASMIGILYLKKRAVCDRIQTNNILELIRYYIFKKPI